MNTVRRSEYWITRITRRVLTPLWAPDALQSESNFRGSYKDGLPRRGMPPCAKRDGWPLFLCKWFNKYPDLLS